MTQRAGEHGFGQVQAPAAVGGERGVERLQPAVLVEGHPPRRVEAVPLAGHRHVLGAAEPQPHRAAGEHRAQGGDRREPVRLHLLAAESATHPQALHGDLVTGEAEHVRDDLLRLARVLGRGLHEHLIGLVDVRQRRVRLEVEVLLTRERELAAEDVRAGGERGVEGAVDVAAAHGRLPTLEGVGGDRLGDGDDRGQRLDVDDDGGRPEPGRLERLGEHPRHRVPDVHHLVGEQRFVALDPGVVDARHVGRREHAHDTGHREGGRDVESGDEAVGDRGLHGVGVQRTRDAGPQVVGVERLPRDVQGRGLVRHAEPDDRALRTPRQGAHDAPFLTLLCAASARRASPSIARRYAAEER